MRPIRRGGHLIICIQSSPTDGCGDGVGGRPPLFPCYPTPTMNHTCVRPVTSSGLRRESGVRTRRERHKRHMHLNRSTNQPPTISHADRRNTTTACIRDRSSMTINPNRPGLTFVPIVLSFVIPPYFNCRPERAVRHLNSRRTQCVMRVQRK